MDIVNGYSLPPPEASLNAIMVELDSDCNSGMAKNVELHPGKYELSLWYRSRFYVAGKPNTNQINVSIEMMDLEGRGPVSAKDVRLVMGQNANSNFKNPVYSWQLHKFTFTVPAYGVYRFWMEAAGDDDKRGGLFNSLIIRYVSRDIN